MRVPSARLLIVSSLGVAVATGSGRARAQDVIGQCIAASDQGLDLRKHGKLAEARRTFAQCAVAACGAEIKETCEGRIAEINAAIPSVVFEASDGAGNDLTAVTVSIDGKPLLDHLDGAAVSLDPGPHAFHFESPGKPPVDRTLVLHEGEKGRREQVLLGTAARAAAPVAPGLPAAPAPAAPRLATVVISTDDAATVSVDGKVVGKGGYRDQIAPGPHLVLVTEQGKSDYRSEIDLRDGETRTVEVTLKSEAHGPLVWPWVAGGVVLVAGAVVGGYFLFKPSNTSEPPPTGKLGGVQFSDFR